MPKIKIFSEPNFTGESLLVEHPGIEDITKLGDLWKNGIVSYLPEYEKIDGRVKPSCLSGQIIGPWEEGPPREKLENLSLTPIFSAEPCTNDKEQEFLIDNENIISNDTHTHFHPHTFDEVTH